MAAAAAPNPCKVRFKLCEDEANSSNPSDSNNSTSTDSSGRNAKATLRTQQQQQPYTTAAAPGRQISNISGASSSGDEFDRQNSFAGNP